MSLEVMEQKQIVTVRINPEIILKLYSLKLEPKMNTFFIFWNQNNSYENIIFQFDYMKNNRPYQMLQFEFS